MITLRTGSSPCSFSHRRFHKLCQRCHKPPQKLRLRSRACVESKQSGDYPSSTKYATFPTITRETKSSQALREIAQLQATSFHEQPTTTLGKLFAPSESTLKIDLEDDLKRKFLRLQDDDFVLLTARDTSECASILGVIELQLLDDSDTACTVASKLDTSIPGSRSDKKLPWIAGMCVDQRVRKQGIGRQLLHAAEEHLQEVWERHFVALHVHTSNKPAFHFYLRCGYSELEREPNWMDSLPWHRHRTLLGRKLPESDDLV